MIDEKTTEDFIFLVIISEIDDRTIPPKAIKNFVLNIVPVIKFAKTTLIILTVVISLYEKRCIVIKAIILAKPNLTPNGKLGKKAFSAIFMTIDKADNIVTYVSFLVLFIIIQFYIYSIRNTNNCVKY